MTANSYSQNEPPAHGPHGQLMTCEPADPEDASAAIPARLQHGARALASVPLPDPVLWITIVARGASVGPGLTAEPISYPNLGANGPRQALPSQTALALASCLLVALLLSELRGYFGRAPLWTVALCMGTSRLKSGA